MMKNALIILYPGCAYFELAAAVSMLSVFCKYTFVAEQAGTVVDLHGLPICVDKSYDEINPSNFDYILIPGGDIGSTLENTLLDEFLLRCASSYSSIIAGICNGALLLAKAGILNGKSCTHMAIPKYITDELLKPILDISKLTLDKINYVDENVVVDGRFVTAKPWAHIDFAVAVLQINTKINSEEAQKLQAYYKGYPYF